MYFISHRIWNYLPPHIVRATHLTISFIHKLLGVTDEIRIIMLGVDVLQ